MDDQRYPIIYIEALKTTAEDIVTDWIFNHPKTSRVIVVTDEVVIKCQQQEIERLQLKISETEVAAIVATVYVIPEGETSKSIQEAERLWTYMADLNFGRNDLLIAFGGGVVGDLTGFCAATYLRGVAFIQIPTTLLSQLDSSVGGKVAVNLPQGKNLVGQFYNPKMVIINVSYLTTLSDEIFVDGLGELIKYGYLGDEILLQWLLHHPNLMVLRQELIEKPLEFEKIVKRCILIKEGIVGVDFREQGIRKYLNFGHTVGHAIEQWSIYELRHGHCVVLGIWMVFHMAMQSATSPSEYEGLAKRLTRLEVLMKQFEIPLVQGLTAAKLMPFLRNDKKSELNGIQFIWPRVRDRALGDEVLQQEEHNERSRDAGDDNLLDSNELNYAQIVEMVESDLQIKWIAMMDLEKILEWLFMKLEAMGSNIGSDGVQYRKQ